MGSIISDKVIFRITKHARQRLKERKIPSPNNNILLSAPSKGQWRRLSKNPLFPRSLNGLTFFVYEKTVIYLCRKKSDRCYILVTAFRI